MVPQDEILLENTVDSNSAIDKDSYTFYQSTDGQLIILRPLNMKCLLYHYGGYERLPLSISGKIIELEAVIKTEATRRRYRYLSHFSLTTVFQLCEIDLSDVLPPNSLAPFIDEMKKQDKHRKQLARKEANNVKARDDVAFLHVDLSSYDLRQLSPKDVAFSSDDFEGVKSMTTLSFTNILSSERSVESPETKKSEVGKKGKKPARMLLSALGGRRC